MQKMSRQKSNLGFCVLLWLMGLLLTPLALYAQTEYEAEEGWVVGHNKGRFNNRPLYLPKHSTLILTGDNPVLRYISDKYLYGTLYFVYECNGVKKSLHEFSDIKSMYKGGWMKWQLGDRNFPELHIDMEVMPASGNFMGSVLKIVVHGRKKGDQLQAVYGEKKDYGRRLTWAFDAMGHPDVLKWGIESAFAEEGRLTLPSSESYLKVEMTDNRDIVVTDKEKTSYKQVRKAMEVFLSRMQIDTPDSYLNAAAMASLKAVDGSWAAPVFLHGCMQWNNRYPGWRTVFGGTMYGWHDRVHEEAKFYIDSQIKESAKTEAKADEQYLLTKQHSNSRYYGKGRIGKDQSFYNMQTQLFDQLVEEYRWNNSPAYVAMLRPALELHLQWQEECFDPDGDGLYESYINTWPTDSQWYNGGGTAEETAYAYRGHLAAYDMAVAAGDSASAAHHRSMLERIRNGFQNLLWLKDKGHSGAYKEQGGYGRVHQDPWLYSIFLPVDAGLTSDIQNLESMYYAEWALQNDRINKDGRVVWTSNWVPAVWSVRELWPGDNYHLAYAYFRSGLAEDGWEVLKGTLLSMAFNHLVPGNLGGQQGGTDFGDCIHPFARTLVSGLFGFLPDYPNGMVTFAPSFPEEWKRASIALPDFSFSFTDNGHEIQYELSVARPAEMKVCVPVSCRSVEKVWVDGKEADYEVMPAVGESRVVVKTQKSGKSKVTVRYTSAICEQSVLHKEWEVNTCQSLQLDGEIQALYDPQGILNGYDLNGNIARLRLNGNTGYHTLVARVTCGSMPQYRVIRVKMEDAYRQACEEAMNLKGVVLEAFDWKPLDISGRLNEDVRMIYKQKYLSPRPNTVSVRIGTDGYSPWTFPHWRSTAPEIKLDKVESMCHENVLKVPQGVSFNWNSEERNIAFVSLWDNYPDKMEFPVGESGKAVCFLVCGSTNMMQCRIANAEIVIVYEDGYRDVMELIPPVNYWNLCPIQPKPAAAGQVSRAYYDSEMDRFSMPEVFPRTVQLGKNCRAMVLPRKLREGVKVEKVELGCLSQEVVVGLMGLSVAK